MNFLIFKFNEGTNLPLREIKVDEVLIEWNDKFYKFYKILKSMEKLKHLEPKFSLAMERLWKKIKRQHAKTANRFQFKARNDDKTTENNRDLGFDAEHSISQDRTEYLVKQSDFVPDGFDGISNNFTEQETKNNNFILADDSYISDLQCRNMLF